ncbi:MAG: ROK family protein [Breznakibacter sp.]
MRFFHFENAFIDQLAGIERKKYVQEIKVIKYLYVNGPRSTADLCKVLKISVPNMIAILGDLGEKNLIEKRGRGVSIGGRKPDLYGITQNCFFVMGVEIGIYTTRMAIFNSANERLTPVKEYTITLNNETVALELLVQSIQQFISESDIDATRLIGIGVSMPGLIDSVKGVNHTYLNFGKKTVVSLLEEKLKRPVFIENDAKAMALAEFRLGLAKTKRDVLVLFLDWGLGLGMILDGKLYKGTSGFAGEFSHIPMVEDGILCRCGKLGCIETVASGTSIVRMAEEGIKAGKSSMLLHADSGKVEKLDVAHVVNAALGGDQYAINVLAVAGKNLGKGISVLIQLFNPELIVLCGKMSEAGEYLTMPVRQAIQTHAMKQVSEHTKIEVSKLGADIGILGALAVVMENIFENYIKHTGR